MNYQDILRNRTKIAKALNDDWSYRDMAEVINITPNAFYNWIHGFYNLSRSKAADLEELITNLEE